jgi:hypothetical protein
MCVSSCAVLQLTVTLLRHVSEFQGLRPCLLPHQAHLANTLFSSSWSRRSIPHGVPTPPNAMNKPPPCHADRGSRLRQRCQTAAEGGRDKPKWGETLIAAVMKEKVLSTLQPATRPCLLC